MNFDFAAQQNALPSMQSAPPLTPTPTNAASSNDTSFGLIVPGRPVQTHFTPVDATGLKFSLRVNYPNDFPGPLHSIHHVVFFLLPTIVLPNDYGVLVYWQITDNQTNASTGFELLGACLPEQPSCLFPTKWSTHEQVADLVSNNNNSHTGGNPPLTITFGVSLEPRTTIDNILGTNTSVSSNGMIGAGVNNDEGHRRLYVAKQIANDLYTFLQSFDTGAASSQQLMMVPLNIFERWYQRFEAKFRRDPNFFLRNKTDDG